MSNVGWACWALVIVAFTGCSRARDESIAGKLLDYPVDKVGPFRVGYRSWKTTYTPPIGDARTIRINVWYPTNVTSGSNPVYGIVRDTDVFSDATLAPPVETAGYPVHVYSHGRSGFGGTSSDLMHYFASHGWVAVAPDHTGDLFPNDTPELPASIYYLRSLDVSAVLDVLESLPADDPLAGKCRTKSVFMSGHSFGALTTWASSGAKFDMASLRNMCSDGSSFSAPCTNEEIELFAKGLSDSRIVSGLPMAGGVGSGPGFFGTTGYDAVKKPMMLMSGTDDPIGADEIFARATSLDFTWLDIAGACHQTFALGACDNLVNDEGYRIVNTYALAFARRAVLGDRSPRITGILSGAEVVSSKVAYRHKP
jgi:predicted dienelactone hydrolase